MLQQLAPYFGYLASLLLAIGLLVSNDLKFRWLNTGGNIAFIFYGVVLGAVPVILTNCILLIINLFYLYKIYNRKEHFELLEFSSGGILVDRFLSFYKTDIAAHFPVFTREQLEGKLNFVVLRDLVIANIFSARVDEDGQAEVLINYTVTKYRDYKVGRFIFDKEKQYLLSKGVRKIYYISVANLRHKKFLTVMGFSGELINGRQCLVKSLV
ncbi:MAG: YgjV family protein [Chitinophagaceae bacterium]|nr:YgjV family protein [Chitinophagaceae bacterium]MBL0131803.1 YgjV family protein [Chitinophagaceae bacterium]